MNDKEVEIENIKGSLKSKDAQIIQLNRDLMAFNETKQEVQRLKKIADKYKYLNFF